MPQEYGFRRNNEGHVFSSRGKPRLITPKHLFPAGLNSPILQCPECNAEQFRIFTSTGQRGEDGWPYIQIVCKCGAAWAAMEVHVPQMTDEVAKQLGLWVPDGVALPKLMKVEEDLERE